VAGRLIALLAFLIGIGANLVDECFRRRSASDCDTGCNRNRYRCSDCTIAEVAMGSESTWHVRIVSRTSLLVQVRFEIALARSRQPNP